MLSYQHAYHAGSRADIHKHNILCAVLVALKEKYQTLDYVETHAGRGLYNLESAPSYKTGEAADGWLAFIKDSKNLKTLSPAYVDCVRKLNDGKLLPRYPGSPKLAADILRSHDHLYMMELHPAEHESLEKIFRKDERVKINKADGLKRTGELVRGRTFKGAGLVLIDPSYEVKEEYETIPTFAADLARAWPAASILIWAPMLPALRHEILLDVLKKKIPDFQLSQSTWAKPGEVRGMYGSVVAGINLPIKI